jgi:hypothetical protein
VGFGADSAAGSCKLVVNASNTRCRYFEWFPGYKYEWWQDQRNDSAWTSFYADLTDSAKEYYAWIINPDGSVGFVCCAGTGNDGNVITLKKILSPDGAVYIDPYVCGETNQYACYYKRDYRRTESGFACFSPDESLVLRKSVIKPFTVGDNSLRTYRLACAATGEYTQFFGGTLGGGLAAMVSAINRITGIYETEAGIRLLLVAKNNLVIYTNSSTDPYTGNNPSLLLTQNQSNLDFIIGNTNYDIGHVFSTSGGGMAGVGVACVTGSKALGETGIYPPTGDAFWIGGKNW